MKLMNFAGPPSAGKTAVIKNIIRKLYPQVKVAYLKIDVVMAFEKEELQRDFADLPIQIVYAGDLCPDHASVMVMKDAIQWAMREGSELLIVESAGLCLRCSPYLNQGLGVIVLSMLGGMNSPLKMGPMVSLADIAVVTKVDLISQAEREVFREKIREVSRSIRIYEVNALQGTGTSRLMTELDGMTDIDVDTLKLKGVPPLGVCTICIGKKDIGWDNHFGVIRKLEGADYLYRGE
ncbi:MAG: cobalamin biosynthesis protein [Deltaproteobacteria bacterium HGW-Deltaproteobacteria-19]|jgi:Ni2+-binding GTPase involved in maturation of urease and hydrogenase|nr:MAG: cobalamin biosynthesis protein [Deltaproteobacteria bacterium HGW-Deltaproteobacteria-19]